MYVAMAFPPTAEISKTSKLVEIQVFKEGENNQRKSKERQEKQIMSSSSFHR